MRRGRTERAWRDLDSLRKESWRDGQLLLLLLLLAWTLMMMMMLRWSAVSCQCRPGKSLGLSIAQGHGNWFV